MMEPLEIMMQHHLQWTVNTKKYCFTNERAK